MVIGEDQTRTLLLITGEVQIEVWLGLKWLSIVDQSLGVRFNGKLKFLFADIFERQNAVETGFVFFEFELFGVHKIFGHSFEYLSNNPHISGFVMTFFNEVHLLFSFVSIEHIVYLFKGNQTILL